MHIGKPAPPQTLPRSSNIELLRIVAMILIIAHHVSLHSGFAFPNEDLSVNHLWIRLIQIGGKTGVNIFVLISGYFSVCAKSFKANKAIKLWLQMVTYSALLYILFCTFGAETFHIRTFLRQFAPITISQWWFASAYFVLYLLSPFLNQLLNLFEKRTYQRFLMLLMVLWCIIPTVTLYFWEGNTLLWFASLYSLGGYIRLHHAKNQVKCTTYLGLAALVAILTWICRIVFGILGTKWDLFNRHAEFLYEAQSLPILILSVLLFLGFLKLNLGYQRWINLVSSATFGVYLIHDHGYMRPFLWYTVFSNATYAESALLIPYTIWVIAVVMISCTIIELIRIHLLERAYLPLLQTLSGAIDRRREKLLSLPFWEKL